MKGVIYYVYALKHNSTPNIYNSAIELCIHSALSFKKHNPSLPISVFSEEEITHPVFEKSYPLFESLKDRHWYDQYCKSQEGEDNTFNYKTKVLRRSPYTQTLYMDIDTFCLDSVGELFKKHDQKDIVFTTSPVFINGQLSFETNFINAGVILYRKTPSTLRIFDRFEECIHLQDEYRCGNDTIYNLIKNEFLDIITLESGLKYNATRNSLDKIIKDRLFNEVKILHFNDAKLRNTLFESIKFNNFYDPSSYKQWLDKDRKEIFKEIIKQMGNNKIYNFS